MNRMGHPITFSHIFFSLRQSTAVAIIAFRLGEKGPKRLVRSGIRTHAHRSGLRPERSALDRSAILTWLELKPRTENDLIFYNLQKKKEWRIRVSIPVPLAC